jgi:hypothetical protein
MAEPKEREQASGQQDQDAQAGKDCGDFRFFLLDPQVRLDPLVDRTQVFLGLGIEINALGDL